MNVETVTAALLGGVIVQVLNLWKLWVKLAVIEQRLTDMERDFHQIANVRIRRDITGDRT